jgi:hypothetical protein
MEELMRELKMAIFDRGAVTEKEVALMRSFIAREGLNECTARMLLDINNVLSGEHHESFDELYMGALLAFLLGDGSVMSEERWGWLRENLLKDGIVDALERRLLETLCRVMTEIPAEMREFAAAHAAA